MVLVSLVSLVGVVRMFRVVTRSGAVYCVDFVAGFWEHGSDGRVPLGSLRVVDRDLVVAEGWGWSDVLLLPPVVVPVVGLSMFLWSVREWRLSTAVVSFRTVGGVW